MHFSIRNIKELRTKNGPAHIHPYYLIGYFVSGKGRVFLNDSFYKIQEGSFVFVPPNALHNLESSNFNYIVIKFDADILKSIIPKNMIDNCFKLMLIELKKSEISTIESVLNDLLILSQNITTNVEELLFKTTFARLILKLLLIGINNPSTKIEREHDFPYYISKAIKFLRSSLAKDIKLEDVASKVETAPWHLSREFKKITHQSLPEYLNNIRLNHAQKLLTTTKKQIKEIAQESGFSSSNYFSIQFKKCLGITPFRFRKEYSITEES